MPSTRPGRPLPSRAGARGAVTPHSEVRQSDNIRLRAEARPDQPRGYPARAAGGVRLPARPDAHRLGARGVEQTLQRRAGGRICSRPSGAQCPRVPQAVNSQARLSPRAVPARSLPRARRCPAPAGSSRHCACLSHRASSAYCPPRSRKRSLPAQEQAPYPSTAVRVRMPRATKLPILSRIRPAPTPGRRAETRSVSSASVNSPVHAAQLAEYDAVVEVRAHAE